MSSFSTLIFDLDDTLIQTTAYLIEPALHRVYNEGVKKRLPISWEEFLKARHDFESQPQSQNFFRYVIEYYRQQEEPDDGQTAQQWRRMFNTFFCADKTHLWPGAHELLSSLQKKYTLYLVTAGDPKTQEMKIQHTKISPYFQQIFFVNVMMNETKDTILRLITVIEAHEAQKFLVIGDRLDKEIRAGQKLGLSTCHMHVHEYGKYQSPDLRPDFIVKSLQDFTRVCKL